MDRLYRSKSINMMHIFLALFVSLLIVILSELSLTWLILLFLAIGFVSVLVWSGNVKDFLFIGMMFTSSIDINKALIVHGGIYVAGFSISMIDVFFVPLMMITIFEKKAIRREKMEWNKLYLFPVLFILWCWFTAFKAPDVFAGILMCVNYTRYFFIMLLVADFIKQPRHLRLAIIALGASISMHLIMVVLQMGTGGAFSIQGTKDAISATSLVFENAGGVRAFRPSGFIGHPNVLADYFVFVLPVLFSLILLGQNKVGRMLWLASIVFFGLGLGTLVVTLSRGGWISFVFAMLFLLGIGYWRGLVTRQLISRLVFLGVIGVIGIILVFPTALLRITESDQRSTESRFVMMDHATLIIKRHLITGVGIGGYREAAENNVPASFADLSEWFQEELLKGVAHNKYLLTMAELGLVGIILFVLMLWRFITAVIKYKYWTDPVYFMVGLGLTAAVFGQTIFFMFDHFYVDIRLTLLFVFFGLIISVLNLQRSQFREMHSKQVV